MTPIHLLKFDTPLKSGQIPIFRGAIVKEMGDYAHPLMHNHTENGLRFSYPLVQYKVFDGNAAIVAFGEVAYHIQEYFHMKNDEITLHFGKMKRACRLIEVEIQEYEFETTESPNYYSITDYIPLTEENVTEYDNLMALTDKISFIESILTGNVISMFKGLNHYINERIVSVICSIENQHTIRYKGVNFRAFDLHFVSNAVLPDYIGLGKSTSIGMGIIQKEVLPENFAIRY